MQNWRPDRPKRAQAIGTALIGRFGKGAPFALSVAAGHLRTWFTDAILAEIDARRLVLWLAPLSMVGVLLYFLAEEEPNIWASLSLSVALLMAFVIFQGARDSIRFFLGAFLAVAMGFISGGLRTLRSDAPILKETVITHVDAIIETIDWSASGGRLLIRTIKLGNKSDDIPFRLRISVASRTPISPGDHISALVRLLPPPFPARPGGYDFARDAYFARIGGVGSALGSVTLLPPIQTDWRLDVMARVDRLRIALTDRIAQSIGGQSGAVAAALFTGKRGYISDETNDDLRAAGIYHVVSISGLHMVLAAGMVFFLVRGILVLVPGVALRFPINNGRPPPLWSALRLTTSLPDLKWQPNARSS